MEIVTSISTDYPEILAFGNRIFNDKFETLLPKLYKQADYVADNHYLIKQDGEIKAMVGSFANALTILDETLTFHGIGTVSVDPSTRGSGFMQQLMNKAVSNGKANGVDFMILGGQRQRYEYFGFTPCSADLTFSAGESAFRHIQQFAKPGIVFTPLCRLPDRVSDCAALYNAQPLHALRSELTFLGVSQSWRSTPYVIFAGDIFAGYLVASDDLHIKELVLVDYANTLPVVLEWVAAGKLKCLDIAVQFFQCRLIQELDKIMEGLSISRGSCINVLNYKNVIRAALKLKYTHTPLMHGKLVIDVHEVGRYRIVVDAGGIMVEDSNEPPDVSLPHIRMMQFLFSPANFFGYDGIRSKLVSHWFPIQLSISSLDNS